jgi:hypothetical protein
VRVAPPTSRSADVYSWDVWHSGHFMTLFHWGLFHCGCVGSGTKVESWSDNGALQFLQVTNQRSAMVTFYLDERSCSSISRLVPARSQPLQRIACPRVALSLDKRPAFNFEQIPTGNSATI